VAHLIVRDGPLRGRRFEIEFGDVTIGRENTVVLIEGDGEVSRSHAVVRTSDGGIEVEDLGSTNGTFVNERRISEPTELSSGDIVRVGQTRLDVVAEEDPNKTMVSGVVDPPTQQHSPPAPPAPPASDEPIAEPAEPRPETESGPGPHVDELPLPSSRRMEEAPDAPPDPQTRQPTSELPSRTKGGALQRAGSARRTLLVVAGILLLALIGYALVTLVADGAPSRADYVASVNEVCDERMPRVDGLNNGRARNTNRAAAAVDVLVSEIEELERPEGNEREINRFVATFSNVRDGLEDLNVSQTANNNRRAQEAERKLTQTVARFEDASRNLGTTRCTFEQ